MAQAEAATRKFREGLGDSFKPWDRETDRQRNKAPRDAEQIAGAFARSFSSRLEAAFKSLPKAEINADSTDAQIKVQELREKMQALADKRIGVDIDAGAALGELQTLQMELERLGTSAEIDVRADAAAALAELMAVQREVDNLSGQTARIEVDVDTREALGDLAKMALAFEGIGAALPVLGGVTLAAGAMGGAFVTASAGVAGFKLVATATMERVKEAVDSADFSKLSPEEYQLAQKWAQFSEVYLKWQRSLDPSVIPALSGGLDLMSSTLPKISPLVAGTASSFVGLEKNAQAALNGPFWTQFLQNVGVAGPQAVTGLGNSFLNVATGLAGVVDAFLPFSGVVVGGVEDASRAFAEWGQQLKTSPEFQEFVQFVKENAPEAWELVKNLAAALGNVGEAVLPLGVGSMSGLNLMASILAGMDPEHIRLIALGILAVKGAQAGLKVADFWSDLTGKLGGLGGAADTAKGKLGGLQGALAGGGIAVLVAGAAIAVDKLSDSLAGLNPDIDATAKRISELTAHGRPAAIAVTELGSNINTLAGDFSRAGTWFAPTIGQFERLDETVRRLTSDNSFVEFGNQIGQTVDSITGDLYSMDTGVQRLDNADKTLAQMVQSGNGDQAAAIFNELAKQAGLAGGDVDKLRALMPQYSSAVEASKQATATTGDALKDMGTSASTAAGNVDTLRGALGQLVGLTTNAMTAEISFKQSLDDATAAAKANGQATSTNTEKGRANREALINLAQSANSYRQALIDQGTPLSEVTAKLGTQRSAFVQLAEKMGFSKTQAKSLADQLGLIPGNVKTDVKTPGGKEALGLIQEYQRKLNELDGKVVSTHVRTIYDSPSGRKAIEQKNREAGGIERYAAGGVQRFAAGGKYSPPPHIATKPTILYGEGSAPEAFIPFDPKYRNRAVSLLGEVAGEFGLEVYNKRAAATVANLATSVEGANVNISASLGSATSMLSQTMGQAGSLTSSINQVGVVGEELGQTWADGSATVSSALADVAQQVGSAADLIVSAANELRDAAMDVAGAISRSRTSSTSSKAKASGTGASEGSIIPPKPGTGGSEGSVIPPKPGSKASSTGRGSLGSVIPPAPGRGSLGSVIPPAPPKAAAQVISGDRVAGTYSVSPYAGVTSSASGLTNSSRVSAPQPASRSSYAPAPTGGGEGSSAMAGSGSSPGGKSVNFYGTTVRESMDADVLFRRAAMYLDNRG
ncbi:hypothetical protein JYK22_05170 [Nonomuraea sp. RK-328]|nr:hypothetical protein [Nonomuraea sp. RK-328]